MAGVERTARAVWKGNLMEGSGTFELSSGAAGPLPVTWASRTEDSGGKTSPEELIAAAHASCFSMALSAGLTRGGNPPESLDVSATTTFDRTDAGFRITKIALSVKGSVPGLDAAAFQEAAEAAKSGCPISNALNPSIPIELSAALA